MGLPWSTWPVLTKATKTGYGVLSKSADVSNQGVITPWSNNHQWVVLDTELLHSRPWASLPMPVVEPVPTIYCLSNSFVGLWMNDTPQEKFGPTPRFGLQVSKINQCWPQDQKVVDPNTMVVPLSELSLWVIFFLWQLCMFVKIVYTTSLNITI